MESLLPTEGEGFVPQEDFSKMKFDFTPDTSQGKIVFTIHGHKGAGKTYGAFAITTGRIGGFQAGRTVALSFDKKTKITKDQWFSQDNIIVHDGKKYYVKAPPDMRVKSGYISYLYMQQLLDIEAKNNPDWIIFDGFTDYTEILEMYMRYINGLKATQGFANRNIWKDRGSAIQDLHDRAMKAAKVGVIYVTYSDKDEIVLEGEVVTKADVPKYIDVVMKETDVVLKATKAKGKDGDLFYLHVETTKYKQYLGTDGKMMPIIDGITLQQGRTYNVTGLAEKVIPTIQQNQNVGQETVLKKPEIPPLVTPTEVKNLPALTLTPDRIKNAIEEIKAVREQDEETEKNNAPSKIKHEIPDLLKYM